MSYLGAVLEAEVETVDMGGTDRRFELRRGEVGWHGRIEQVYQDGEGLVNFTTHICELLNFWENGKRLG